MFKKSLLAMGALVLASPAMATDLASYAADYSPELTSLTMKAGSFQDQKTVGAEVSLKLTDNVFATIDYSSVNREGTTREYTLTHVSEVKDNLRFIKSLSDFSFDHDVLANQSAKIVKLGFEYDLDSEVRFELGAERYLNKGAEDATHMYYGLSYDVGVTKVALIHSDANNSSMLSVTFPLNK
jgi:hypothetical protein